MALRQIVILMAIVTPTYAYDESDYTWFEFNGHRYAATFSVGSWNEVQAEAEAIGANLVVRTCARQVDGSVMFHVGLNQGPVRSRAGPQIDSRATGPPSHMVADQGLQGSAETLEHSVP